MLMDLETLDWDDELLSFFGIPRQMLPQIRPSSVPTRTASPSTTARLAARCPSPACSATSRPRWSGRCASTAGEAKNTYGTGNFLLLNTGEELVRSSNGLLTTVCYQLGQAPPVYALEGSIAVTGSAVQWLRDQLGIISGAGRERERWPRQVPDNGGVYFVPAFSGLFAPYWRSDARGAIVGLSRFNTNAHVARATLEAICYQSRDVAEAMEEDSGVHVEVLKVDGGVTANDLCMQIQADILGVARGRPVVAETTALGAAYAAGLAVGFWTDPGTCGPELGRSPSAGRHSGPTSSGRTATPAGAKRSSGPWAGSRWTDVQHPDARALPTVPPRSRDSPADELDVLVIGGGVVGGGCALDAVTRGLTRRAGRGARLRRRARPAGPRSCSTAGCATSSSSTSGWCSRRCGSAPWCSTRCARTSLGRCR